MTRLPGRQRRRLRFACLAGLLWVGAIPGLVPPLAAGSKAAAKPIPPLVLVHKVGSSSATFRTPQNWVIAGVGTNPEVVNADGGDIALRILRWDSEVGLDGIHAVCLDERRGEPAVLAPTVKYEYDFRGGERAGRRILDSAFDARYEAPVKGFADWHTRVITIVGKGETFCIAAFCPQPLWKRPSPAKELLLAVLSSLSLP